MHQAGPINIAQHSSVYVENVSQEVSPHCDLEVVKEPFFSGWVSVSPIFPTPPFLLLFVPGYSLSSRLGGTVERIHVSSAERETEYTFHVRYLLTSVCSPSPLETRLAPHLFLMAAGPDGN